MMDEKQARRIVENFIPEGVARVARVELRTFRGREQLAIVYSPKAEIYSPRREQQLANHIAQSTGLWTIVYGEHQERASSSR